MELLIIASLSFIGYELARKKSLSIKEKQETLSKVPMKAKKEIQKMNSPLISQNQPVPFFRSEKSQNTNDNVKDHRLSTFTGVDNLDYIHRKENAPQFKPIADLTNIRGSQNTLDAELDHYVTSSIHNNTLPFKQEKVGRGLGIDPSQSAGGGFHEQTRVLPDNVNGYRKNTYEGRVVPGVAKVTNRTMESSLAQNRDVVRCVTRDVMPAKSYFDAQSARADQTVSYKQTNRGNCNSIVGIAHGQENTYTIANTSRTQDYTRCFDPGNPHQSHSGQGAYTNSKYLMDSEESTLCAPPINVQNMSRGVYSDVQDDLKNTMRGQENCHTGVLSGGHQKGLPNYNYDAKPTIKRYSSNCEDYYTGSARGNQQTQARHHQAAHTQRGQYNKGIGGPAGSYLKSSTQYQANYYQQQENPQMGRELVSSAFTPGPGRMNLNLDSKEAINDVNIDKHAKENEYVPVSTIPNQNNYNTIQNMGIVNIPQKLPESNQRLQLSIASDQLKSNELHVSII